MTTAQMKELASFAGWDISDQGGAGKVWRIYEGETYPLLASFLTPLTIATGNVTITYSGAPWNGGGELSYAGFRPGDDASILLGTLVYGGSSQGAIAPGTYTISPLGGLYSGQQGYDIKYLEGTLTIEPPTSPLLTNTATSKGLLEVSEIRSSLTTTDSADGSKREETGCLASHQGACIVQ
jgi:hypothetical protein